jgi:drug/metabolite transporter (DMT)-like permease
MVIISYIFVCLIFGTTFLTIKMGIEAGAPPLFSAGIRFFAAGLLVVLFFMLKRHRIKAFLFSKEVAFAGFCLTFVTFATLYWAEQYITSGLAAVLSATGPMAILFVQAKREKAIISKEQFTALLIALGGVICVSFPGIQHELSYMWIMACGMIVGGEFFYAIGTLNSKAILTAEKTVSPFLINGVQMLYGGFMLMFFSLLTERPDVSAFIGWDVWMPIIYLIFVGSIGGHGLYYWLLSKTNPVFPSTWLYVSPLIAVGAGYIWLDEPVKPVMGIGAILILTGVFLVNRAALHSYWKQGKLLKKAV